MDYYSQRCASYLALWISSFWQYTTSHRPLFCIEASYMYMYVHDNPSIPCTFRTSLPYTTVATSKFTITYCQLIIIMASDIQCTCILLCSCSEYNGTNCTTIFPKLFLADVDLSCWPSAVSLPGNGEGLTNPIPNCLLLKETQCVRMPLFDHGQWVKYLKWLALFDCRVKHKCTSWTWLVKRWERGRGRRDRGEEGMEVREGRWGGGGRLTRI